MSPFFVAIILTITVHVLPSGHGSRILGIFPTASLSHQVVFRGLTLALNKRGHELVVITTDPVNDLTLKNYTEISISFIYDDLQYGNLIDNRGAISWLEGMQGYTKQLDDYCERVLNIPEVMKLIAPNSGEKFDLILVEVLYTSAYFALGERFDAPVVGMTSLPVPVVVHYGLGNPLHFSHPSNWEFRTKLPETWIPWKRLNYFVEVWKFIYFYRNVFMPRQEAIARKYFGDDISSLADAERNISLIFVNQQNPIIFTRPNVPKIIEIGGLHISKHSQPLPENLQKVLDEATQGFVYMSLGSNVKSNMLSDKHRIEFIAAFSKLPYKVIWKFEDDDMPNKPSNLEIMKWTPQQAILAHPNLKVFIYQGGIQSTEEAIDHAVPLIGLPVMGDQDTQVEKMVSLGVARKLEITEINRNNLLEAIHTVINDSSYKQNMLKLRSVIQDKPYDPLENAIWWTEYVIRHRGAPYLRSSLADEPWYQRGEMDVIAFISAGLTILLILGLVISYQCLGYIMNFFNDRTGMHKSKKQS